MTLSIRRPGRRSTLSALALLSLLPASGLAAWPRSAAQQQPPDRDQAAIFQAMSEGHAQFRRAVLAELHKIAAKRDQKLDFQSLIITSCSDSCMLAGVAASRAEPKEPAAGAAKLDTREPLGLIAVAGSFLSIRSRTIDASGPAGEPPGARAAGQVGTVQLRPGFYVVRHGPRQNLLELVNLEQQVAVTVPFQPGPGGRGKGDAPRGAPDAQGELGEASEWPTIFMELLHAVDLNANR